MNENISKKTDDFRNLLRKKYIEQHFEKQRLNLQKKKKAMEGQLEIHCLHLLPIKQFLQRKNRQSSYEQLTKMPIYEGLKQLHRAFELFQEELLLIILKTVDEVESISLLSYLIVHLCSWKQPATNLSLLLSKYNICGVLYAKLDENFNKNGNLKMIKLLLSCLKNCAFFRVQELKKPIFLQKYLSKMINELIDETSMLVILANLSETYLMPVSAIERLCVIAHSKNELAKISSATIIMNFIVLASQQQILQCFTGVCSALMHLILKSHSYSQSSGLYCFEKLGCLIQKISFQNSYVLWEMIQQCKLENFLIINLQIGAGKKKKMTLDVVDEIVIKMMAQPTLLRMLNEEIIFYLMEGLEFADVEIVSKCLKILIRLCHSNQTERLYLSDKEENFSYVIENLLYHENENINVNAQILLDELRNYSPSDMTQ